MFLTCIFIILNNNTVIFSLTKIEPRSNHENSNIIFSFINYPNNFLGASIISTLIMRNSKYFTKHFTIDLRTNTRLAFKKKSFYLKGHLSVCSNLLLILFNTRSYKLSIFLFKGNIYKFFGLSFEIWMIWLTNYFKY